MTLLQQQPQAVEIHQLEGFDPHGRSFNRNVQAYRLEKGFSTRFHYEDLRAESQTFYTIPEAVKDMVRVLQEKGFRNLRTRVNFKGKRYLAERRSWIDYPDP